MIILLTEDFHSLLRWCGNVFPSGRCISYGTLLRTPCLLTGGKSDKFVKTSVAYSMKIRAKAPARSVSLHGFVHV